MRALVEHTAPGVVDGGEGEGEGDVGEGEGDVGEGEGDDDPLTIATVPPKTGCGCGAADPAGGVVGALFVALLAWGGAGARRRRR
jgi:MYXO-CTERM domain-containing protein